MKNLYKKLADFQKEVTAITKDSENPFFRSKYFDVNKVIETIRPILNKLGLVVLQPLTNLDGKTALKTLIIDSESGESIEDVTLITELPKAQDMGSSVTYFRRYSLVSFLLLQGENDDDGNIASSNVKYTSKYSPKTDKGIDITKTDKIPFGGTTKKVSVAEDLPFN